jgi:hypothetical protein
VPKRSRLIVGGLAAIVVIAIGAGMGVAAGGEDERPLTGSAHDRATAAALEHVGGGAVTETEVGEDGAAYEVGVRRADGSEVEIKLDANFDVTGTERDDDRTEDQTVGDED